MGWTRLNPFRSSLKKSRPTMHLDVKSTLSLRTAVLTLISVLLLPFSLHAQNATGSLLGEVQDASGARIKSAKVTVTDNGSGVERKATTDSHGQFRLPDLMPGNYHVAVNAPGF